MTPRIRIFAGAGLGAGLVGLVGASCALVGAVIPTGLAQVRVSVKGTEQNSVRTFDCSVHLHFKGGVGLPVPGISIVRIESSVVEIRGLAPGEYRVEVRAEGFAKEYSRPFSIGGRDEQPRIRVVCVNEGGGIRGIVRDELGRPVAGARVTTSPHGFRRNAFTKFFPMHFEATEKTVRTNSNGLFELLHLRPDRYQVEIQDQKYCPICVGDIAVMKGEVVTMDEVELLHGCEISGVATLEKELSNQVQVDIAPVERSHGDYLFRRSVRTDVRSRFRFPGRLPPGRYRLTYREVSTTPIDLGWLRREKIVDVAHGRASLRIKLDVSW